MWHCQQNATGKFQALTGHVIFFLDLMRFERLHEIFVLLKISFDRLENYNEQQKATRFLKDYIVTS